jgi:hypothetical protein
MRWCGKKGGADDFQYDAATGRIYFVGTTGTVAVFKRSTRIISSFSERCGPDGS